MTPHQSSSRRDHSKSVASGLAFLGLTRPPNWIWNSRRDSHPTPPVRLRIVPYAVKDGWARAIMADPMDLSAADEASASLGLPVQREGIDTERFNDLVRRAYGTTAARMAEDLAGEAEDNDYEHNLDAIEADDIHRMAEQPTLINLVNLLLIEAIQSRTSDVHVEPFESELKIKYRIDGELVEQSPRRSTCNPH